MNINFKDGRFHVYHSEGGEQVLKWLTRINVLFMIGNTALLTAEMISPRKYYLFYLLNFMTLVFILLVFGYWHAVSESLTIGLNLIGSKMLHYYSTRMINNIWLLEDGKTVQIEFMDAFFVNKTENFRILNFGALEPSRLLNVDMAIHEMDRKVYVNKSRNLYSISLNPEY